MTTDQARRWIVLASLAMTGGAFAFFLLAPLAGYPLEFRQALRIFQIVFPVFFGYLGSATHFVFKAPARPKIVPNPALFGILVRGPLFIFAIASVIALIAFGWSNRRAAPPGTGMGIEDLATVISGALGLLAVTTGVVTAYLFAVDRKH